MANAIAENLYSQVDSEAHSFAVLQEIIGHERDNMAVSSGDLLDEKPCFTTKGSPGIMERWNVFDSSSTLNETLLSNADC
jgi:hypothetical protein